MGPGPGWMMARITAVRCMWQHLLQAKQLRRVGESQDKELGAERETAEGRDEKREDEEVWLSLQAVTRHGKCHFG